MDYDESKRKAYELYKKGKSPLGNPFHGEHISIETQIKNTQDMLNKNDVWDYTEYSEEDARKVRDVFFDNVDLWNEEAEKAERERIQQEERWKEEREREILEWEKWEEWERLERETEREYRRKIEELDEIINQHDKAMYSEKAKNDAVMIIEASRKKINDYLESIWKVSEKAKEHFELSRKHLCIIVKYAKEMTDFSIVTDTNGKKVNIDNAYKKKVYSMLFEKAIDEFRYLLVQDCRDFYYLFMSEGFFDIDYVKELISKRTITDTDEYWLWRDMARFNYFNRHKRLLEENSEYQRAYEARNGYKNYKPEICEIFVSIYIDCFYQYIKSTFEKEVGKIDDIRTRYDEVYTRKELQETNLYPRLFEVLEYGEKGRKKYLRNERIFHVVGMAIGVIIVIIIIALIVGVIFLILYFLMGFAYGKDIQELVEGFWDPFR